MTRCGFGCRRLSNLWLHKIAWNKNEIQLLGWDRVKAGAFIETKKTFRFVHNICGNVI